MSLRAVASLHIDTGREYRGGQRQVRLLLQALAAQGHPVALALPPGARLAECFAAEGALDIELLEAGFRGELSLPAVRDLRRLLRSRRWDVIDCHTAHAITYAWLARGRAAGPPIVAHRRVDFPLGRNPLSRWKRRWPDLWIAVASSVERQLIRDGIARERIRVVSSALDPEALIIRRPREEVRRELKIPEGALLAGTVGALAEHKGQRLLIEAVARLGESRPHLVIAGEGSLRGALEALVAERGLGGSVSFLGHRDRIADLLAALDLFVFPSLSGEGSPAGLKEPIALGVSVIASDLPAHREIGLEPRELFPPGDVDALTARMRRVLDEPEAARRRAAQLRPLAERFSVERLLEDTLTAYRAVL